MTHILVSNQTHKHKNYSSAEYSFLSFNLQILNKKHYIYIYIKQ